MAAPRRVTPARRFSWVRVKRQPHRRSRPMPHRFILTDVFTDRAFGGNQLAVFPDATNVPEALMQPYARALNFSETTFVLPPRKPGHSPRVRIFTPTKEIPFAGHPNVGTAVVLAAAGKGGQLVFDED